MRPHQIAYDAETTLGGSGGPIFSLSGRVIGVNYATVRGFGSANFGIPIRFGLALLQQDRTGEAFAEPKELKEAR